MPPAIDVKQFEALPVDRQAEILDAVHKFEKMPVQDQATHLSGGVTPTEPGKIESALQAVDKYSGGTGMRAGVNALIEGRGFSGAKDAAVAQYGENPPPAPSGYDQMKNAGVKDETRIVRAGPLVFPVNASTLGAVAEQLENPMGLLTGPLGKLASKAGPLFKAVEGFTSSPLIQKIAGGIGALEGFKNDGIAAAYAGYKMAPGVLDKGVKGAEKLVSAYGKVTNSPTVQKAASLANTLKTPAFQAVLRRLETNYSQ